MENRGSDDLLKPIPHPNKGYLCNVQFYGDDKQHLEEHFSKIGSLNKNGSTWGVICTRAQELTFDQLREANKARLPQFKNKHGDPAHSTPTGEDWSPLEWAASMNGELGEVLVEIGKMLIILNTCKKNRTGDITLDELRERLKKELADLVCYADLTALRLNIDLGQAIKDKFNEVSEKIGSEVRLPNLREYPIPVDEAFSLKPMTDMREGFVGEDNEWHLKPRIPEPGIYIRSDNYLIGPFSSRSEATSIGLGGDDLFDFVHEPDKVYGLTEFNEVPPHPKYLGFPCWLYRPNEGRLLSINDEPKKEYPEKGIYIVYHSAKLNSPEIWVGPYFSTHSASVGRTLGIMYSLQTYSPSLIGDFVQQYSTNPQRFPDQITTHHKGQTIWIREMPINAVIAE